MNPTIALPVVYRDHSGDYAAFITAVNEPDPNIRDSVQTVDLAVLRPGLMVVIHESNVPYSTSAYGGFRLLGEEWDDQSVSAPAETASAPVVDETVPALGTGVDEAELAAFRAWQSDREKESTVSQAPPVPEEVKREYPAPDYPVPVSSFPIPTTDPGNAVTEEPAPSPDPYSL